jgi:hypothetical protein
MERTGQARTPDGKDRTGQDPRWKGQARTPDGKLFKHPIILFIFNPSFTYKWRLPPYHI